MMRSLLLGCVVTGLASCAVSPPGPVRPGAINHVVFFELHDPAEAEALIADCDALLATIPVVTAYYAGTHVDAGRSTVLSDYDVGCFVAFDSLEAYAEYVEHPNHVLLVEKWGPRLSALRVYDVGDETP